MEKTQWTVAELLTADFEVNGEAEYRRGYCDGWIDCVNALHRAMSEHGMTWIQVLDWVWHAWLVPLTEWAHGDCATEVLPPTSALAGYE